MENIGFYDGNNSVRTSRLAFEAESPRIISRSSDARTIVSNDNNNDDGGGGGGGCSGGGVVIMDIMTVDGCSCDVLMDSEKISWIPLSGERTKSGSCGLCISSIYIAPFVLNTRMQARDYLSYSYGLVLW